MNRQSFSLTIGLLLLFAAVLHLGRVLLGWQLVLGNIEIPVWFSVVLGLFALYMSYQGFLFSKKK